MVAREPMPDIKRKARSDAGKPTPVTTSRASPHVVASGGRDVTIEGTSVFEQLGFSRDETAELLAPVVDEVLRRRNGIKNALVDCLESIARAEKLNITQMAERVAITRPRLSSIMNRDFDKVSIDAVVDVIHKFGKDVRVQVVDAPALAKATRGKTRGPRVATVGARA